MAMRKTLRMLWWINLMALLCSGLPGVAVTRIMQVGLVTDVGKVDDRTFNEFAYQGMMRASKEFGLKSAFIETLQPTDYEKNIEQFAAAGYEMIITVGFMLGHAARLQRCRRWMRGLMLFSALVAPRAPAPFSGPPRPGHG